MPRILAECGALKSEGAEGPPRERRASKGGEARPVLARRTELRQAQAGCGVS